MLVPLLTSPVEADSNEKALFEHIKGVLLEVKLDFPPAKL
jgi:hypothetical protein